MNVYYACLEPKNALLHPPEPVLNEVRKNLIEKDFSNFNNFTQLGGADALTKCPAFVKDFKNKFAIKSIFDYNIDNQMQDGVRVYGSNIGGEEEFKQTLLIRDANRGLLSLLLPHIWFIPDKPVMMSQSTATYSNSHFSHNTYLIEGSYDSYRHPRSTDISFFIKNFNEPIQIREGDTLYYLKFHTEEKINFIPFAMDDNLSMMNDHRMRAFKNRSVKNYALDFWYKLNKSNGYPKRILDYIKKNSL